MSLALCPQQYAKFDHVLASYEEKLTGRLCLSGLHVDEPMVFSAFQDSGDSEPPIGEGLKFALRDRDALVQVKASRLRIKSGTFGRCVNCGLVLSQSRLEVLPYAARCLACQKLEEDAEARYIAGFPDPFGIDAWLESQAARPVRNDGRCESSHKSPGKNAVSLTRHMHSLRPN
ncbi:MAG: TraR/DksA C4-type zinc finger protein [Pseudomonadota bacterium]